MRIIAEMLGVDVDRIADFRRWSTGVIDAISGSGRAKSPGYALKMAGELFQYMRSVADARSKQPTDDLISVLVDPNQRVAMTTQEVFEHHLSSFAIGIDELMKDYTDDSVLIAPEGTYRGLGEIRAFFQGFINFLF